jgi:hypothetical protein
MYLLHAEDLVHDRIAGLRREAAASHRSPRAHRSDPPELPPVRTPRLIVGRLIVRRLIEAAGNVADLLTAGGIAARPSGSRL